MNLGIEGKRVLITGASRGIGASTARAFAQEGAIVLGVARKEDQLKDLIENLGGQTKKHGWIAANLLDQGEPTRVAKIMLEKFGQIDIVIHNVGSGLGIKDIFAPVEDWEHVWRFNVGVAIEMNGILIPPMQKRKWGRVVHISSVSAEHGEPSIKQFGGAVPYAAAKSYLNAYTKGLGREMAPDNIVVTALMPGVLLIEGKYWDKLKKTDPQLVESYINQYQAIERFGSPEEIAPFAVFLASEHAAYACASIVPVDGGRR